VLVFVDESGDPGLKLNSGSSRYFVVTLLYFTDLDEANRADSHIGEIRRSFGLPEGFEFHFNKLNNYYRTEFLKRMAGFDFSYFSMVLNKTELYAEGFKFKDSFYKYTCKLVFDNAKAYLSNATVIVDGSGSKEFRKQLEGYLKRRINASDENKHIKKLKIQDSHRNNLLQLADMVCGAVARSFRENRGEDCAEFRKLMRKREKYVQLWPKKKINPSLSIEGTHTIR
jgi:hypothetical protein